MLLLDLISFVIILLYFYKTGKKMDVRNMISSLESWGFSQGEISRQTGIPQSALSFVRNGKRNDVMYSAGKKLESMYKKAKRANATMPS
jgi:predicted XRE-type DNA-binding protein